MNSPPRIVYIAGTGRTGSTLLGQCLSCSGQALFVGELTHLWKRGFVEDELCGCGRPVSQCGFWQHVAGELKLGEAVERSRLAELRDRVCRLGRWPLVALQRPLNSPDDQTYCGVYRQLTQTLAAVGGRQVIIDSSKYPTDLAVLAGGGLPLEVLHVVRDCRAVVYAWKKRKLRTEIHWRQEYMPRYSAWQTAVAWRVFNRLIPKIARQYELPYRMVRYEPLMLNFPRSLQELCVELGLPGVQPSDRSLANAHHVAANPSRFEFEPAAVRVDDEWKSQLSALDRWIVRVVCGSQQRALGYGSTDWCNAADLSSPVRQVGP